MTRHLFGLMLLAFSEVTLAMSTTIAADPGPSPAIAGWSELTDALRELPDRMLAKLPEAMRNDPQVQQEVGRLILESLAYSTIDAIGSDGDHPVFLPASGPTLNIGQPNADTVYRIARITPAGTYRLRGESGSLRIASIGQVGPTPGEPGATSAHPGPTKSYHDLNGLPVDAHGRFDVILSPTRPAGHQGDWWQLLPTNKLLLRMVSSDWSRDRDLTLSIERLDAPVRRSRPSAASLEHRLRQLPGATAFMATLFVDHVEMLRQQGYVNKLKVFDVSQMGGLEGQFYYEGAYDLGDDVVSAKDPGVPNWLDIAGYPRGVVQGRWTDCDSQPVPSVRKVTFTQLRSLLPADTPVFTPPQREANNQATPLRAPAAAALVRRET